MSNPYTSMPFFAWPHPEPAAPSFWSNHARPLTREAFDRACEHLRAMRPVEPSPVVVPPWLNGVRVVHGEARADRVYKNPGPRWYVHQTSPTRVRTCRGSQR